MLKSLSIGNAKPKDSKTSSSACRKRNTSAVGTSNPRTGPLNDRVEIIGPIEAHSIMTRHTVRFFNTYEPVCPLFRDLFPELGRRNRSCVAVISDGVYRTRNSGPPVTTRMVHVPSTMRRNKRLSGLSYALVAPFVALTEKSSLDVYLTQPPLFFSLASLISRVRRIPYVIHVMDVQPHLAVQAGLLRSKGLLSYLLRTLTTISYRYATKIIVIGRCMEKRLREMDVEPAKIIRITNWANRNLHPVETKDNQFRRKHGLGRRPIIMYSGNMGQPHHLETILRVSARMEKSHPGTVFVFIGKGIRRREVEEQIRRGANNVRLLNYQPEGLLAHSLSSATAHFISLQAGYEGLVVPSKFYGALACGRPVIYEGFPGGEIALTIREYGCGKVVDFGDEPSLFKAVCSYISTPDTAESDGRRGLKAYKLYLSGKRQIEQYAEMINSILSANS